MEMQRRDRRDHLERNTGEKRKKLESDIGRGRKTYSNEMISASTLQRKISHYASVFCWEKLDRDALMKLVPKQDSECCPTNDTSCWVKVGSEL